jgi:hypothetical protein
LITSANCVERDASFVSVPCAVTSQAQVAMSRDADHQRLAVGQRIDHLAIFVGVTA